MDTPELLQGLFRWIHVVAGIVWIGHLYFFNFVNAPFEGTLDGPAKKVVVPQLRPRALYWFRWGAAWTWVTGVLLLLIVFYHQRAAFADEVRLGPGLVMLLVTILAFAVYDALAKSPVFKELRNGAAVGLVLVALIVWAGYIHWAGFGYRGYVIHVGAMFGTIMAANVWMRIWPAQQKIITAIRDGQAPDPAWVAMAGGRSRHNTYLSVPLVWTMINQHTTVPWAEGPVWLFVMIVVGWTVTYWMYSKAGQVKGF